MQTLLRAGLSIFTHIYSVCLSVPIYKDGWMEGFYVLYFRTSEGLIGQTGTTTMRRYALVGRLYWICESDLEVWLILSGL